MTDHDDLDAGTAAEFADYRRAVREMFPQPPSAAIFSEARNRTTRRRVATLLAAAAAVVAVLAGTVMLRPAAAPQPPAAPSSGGSSSAPAEIDGYTPGVPPAPDKGNQVLFLDQQTADRLRGMTVTLPAWQGLATQCPAGQFTFHAGKAVISGAGDLGYTTDYAILHKGLRAIFAELDGEPGDEIVAPLGCGMIELQFRLLALKVEPGGFRALGYVADGSEQVTSFDRFYPDGQDLVVEVSDGGGQGTFEQRRHFQWRDSRFVQVSGPTVFPGEVDMRSVDLRNWSIHLPIVPEDGPPCGNGGWLSFVGGASGAWGYAEPGISLTAAEYFVGGISRGFLNEPADPYRVDAPDVLVTMTCRGTEGRTDEWVQHVSHVAHTTTLLKVGVDGVTGIVSHRIVDGLAEVTVRTAGGEEVRRYSFDSYRFTRVS